MNTAPIAKYWLDLSPRGLDPELTDKLMTLPEGRNYIALYALLYNGHYGENTPWPPKTHAFIPFDVLAIQKELGIFSLRTISKALNVYDELGLIGINKSVFSENDDGFVPPTKEEVEKIIRERKFICSADDFLAYYEKRDWYGETSKIRNWKKALASFEGRERQKAA